MQHGQAADLLRFLTRLVRDAEGKVFLILDRLPVHRSAGVRAWLAGREAEIELFYLPPYGPKLNSDEGINGDLKQAVTRKQPARSKAQLKRAVLGHMRRLSKLLDRVRSFFGHKTFRYAVYLKTAQGGSLKLCGSGEWPEETHGTRRRRSWRKLHLSADADTGQIVATKLTGSDADDRGQVGPLLRRVGELASFTGGDAYDRDDVYAVAARHPDADVIVPPRSSAVSNATAEIAPTQRDRHMQAIAEYRRRGCQKTSGYTWGALVEADVSRWKRVIGPALRSRTDGRQATEGAIAAEVLNRMLDLGRPDYVRIA
jgi:transposase